MQIAFWHSIRVGGSPLMAGLQRGLETLGHNVVTCHSQGRYDLVVMFNQIAHDPTYQYPDFPAPNPIAFIDAAEYGYFRRLPGVACDYLNAFSPGSVNHDTKNVHQQALLRDYLEGKSFPYFLREKFKFVEWPDTYHGINYPLYLHSEDPTPPNRDEYLSRSLPFWQSWGASHPWRWPITYALREAGYECLVLEENGHPRLPQGIYFPKMRSARACCSFDGYGSSSFRRTEVLVRTCLLEGPLSVGFPHPLIDGETCVQFDVRSAGEEFLSTDIVQKLEGVLADPERAFEIYRNGFEWCWQYFTEVATAQYVLDVVQGHDWSKATPLNL